MNGAVSRTRLGINRWLARDPLFGYYFTPAWGTIVLMARARKAAVFLRSDFHREIESISLQEPCPCEPSTIIVFPREQEDRRYVW
jgi:hypothetical protein